MAKIERKTEHGAPCVWVDDDVWYLTEEDGVAVESFEGVRSVLHGEDLRWLLSPEARAASPNSQSPSSGEKDSSPSPDAVPAEPASSATMRGNCDGAGDPAGGGEEGVIGQRCAACGAEWLTDMQVDELSDAVEARCAERLAEIRKLRAERDELRSELAWEKAWDVHRKSAYVELECEVRRGHSLDRSRGVNDALSKLDALCAESPLGSLAEDQPAKSESPKPQGEQGPTEALREQLCSAIRKVFHGEQTPVHNWRLLALADELEGKAGK